MKSKTELVDIARGTFPLAAITLNLTFWMVPLLLLAILKLATPHAAARRFFYRLMIGIYFMACQVDIFLFKVLLGIQFEVDPLDQLHPGKNYLVLSNHKSWADILVLQSVLINKTPIIKFIVKRELLYLPLVGLICWAYEYPMVARKSFRVGSKREDNPSSDLEILKNKLGDISRNPAAVINFAEGTRVSPEKRSRFGSPHQNLLKARTGGLFFIMNTFGHRIDDLLNITISYNCPAPVFFRFLGGKCKTVRVQVDRIPMAALLRELSDGSGRLDYQRVDRWLQKTWTDKDRQLG